MTRVLLGLIFVVGFAGTVSADEVEDRYNKTCVVCHAAGAAGAPKTGVAAEWEERMGGLDHSPQYFSSDLLRARSQRQGPRSARITGDRGLYQGSNLAEKRSSGDHDLHPQRATRNVDAVVGGVMRPDDESIEL